MLKKKIFRGKKRVYTNHSQREIKRKKYGSNDTERKRIKVRNEGRF